MREPWAVSPEARGGDSLGRRVSPVGRVGPHLEVKVIDPETGRTVPRGAPGELCTRGYSVMLGYWQQPDKTAEAVDAAHWMRTGDLAVMDSDGYLAITARIKDMVIRGAENVYPREIEEVLYTHPDILDAQVILARLVTGRREFASSRAFYEGDLAAGPRIDRIFAEHPGSDAVRHCAALLVVPDSVAAPVLYYRANVAGTLEFAAHLPRNRCERLIFSSSASISRAGEDLSVDADSRIDPQSP